MTTIKNILKKLSIPIIESKDNVEIIHYDIDGKIKDKKTYRNLITNVGKAAMASRLNGDGAEPVFNYCAIGIGVTAAAITDTALVSEITTFGGQRAIATVSRITTAITNDTAQWTTLYSFAGSFAITEAGLFNAASIGVLLARRVFSPINVVSGDSIQITWKIQLT